MDASPLDPIGSRSLVVRAREAILTSILGGRFADGRLPPEEELAEMLGVSRTTVRGALQSLAQHGVLSRTPGRGTVVRSHMKPSMVALQRLIGFTRLLAEQGHEVTHQGSYRETDSAPPEAVKALGLEGVQAYYCFERLMFASGRPAIWAIDYFPIGVFTRVPSMRESFGESPFEMGRQFLAESIASAIVEIVPRLPSPEVRRKLELGRPEPYILLHETHFSSSGTALGFSLIHVNNRFVRFQLMRRGDGG